MEAWDETVRSRRHGAMPPFHQSTPFGEGEPACIGSLDAVLDLPLMRRKEADGAFRWPLPVCHLTDAERVELPSRVLETRVLPLDEASRKREGDA